MELLSQAMVWIKWLGIGGVIGGLALVIFAPSIARVVADFLGPIAKATGEAVVWFFRDVLWEGFKDMSDNLASIAFVTVCILIGGYFLSSKCDPKPIADKAVAQLRKDYRFVPLTPAEKRVRRNKDQAAPCWYCLW